MVGLIHQAEKQEHMTPTHTLRGLNQNELRRNMRCQLLLDFGWFSRHLGA